MNKTIGELVTVTEPMNVGRVEQMMAARYHMPAQTQAALKEVAALVVAKLSDFITSQAFDKLHVRDKLRVFDTVMNRAHGLPEAPTAAASIMAEIAAVNSPELGPVSLGDQLTAIEERRPFPERASPTTETNRAKRRAHLKGVSSSDETI